MLFSTRTPSCSQLQTHQRKTSPAHYTQGPMPHSPRRAHAAPDWQQCPMPPPFAGQSKLPSPHPMPQQQVANPLQGNAKYEKVQDLNSGAFGFVQLCRNKQTGEHVAIKVRHSLYSTQELGTSQPPRSFTPAKHTCAPAQRRSDRRPQPLQTRSGVACCACPCSSSSVETESTSTWRARC